MNGFGRLIDENNNVFDGYFKNGEKLSLQKKFKFYFNFNRNNKWKRKIYYL